MIANYRPSTFLIVVATIILSLGLLGWGLAYRTAENIRHDANIINHAGIVRGSIQRATKLALSETSGSEQSAAEVINTVDGLMDRFLSGEEGYRHKGADQESELIGNMHAISRAWQDLKEALAQYKLTRSEADRRRAIIKSEECWWLADAGVLAAQRASERKLAGIAPFYGVSALAFLNTAVVVWFAYAYVRRRLEFNAAYDVTTRLRNRRSYDAEIEREVSRSRRYNRPLSLVLFDMDRFKAINDNCGHKAGDDVLLGTADLAQQHVRKTDCVFRIGGDEFAILLPETDAALAYEVAEKIRKAIERHSFAPVEQVTITAGVSELESDMTVETLHSLADSALYQAKQTGRNRTGRVQAEVAPTFSR